MKQIQLPHTQLTVSTLCFGAGSFGTGIRGDGLDRLLDKFLEAGGNFFDSAHCYAFWTPEGAGASERELSASLRRLGHLEDAVIATKGGHPDAGPDYPRPDSYLSPEILTSDIEDSLRNLGMGRISLYFLHRDDPRVPVSEIMDALNGHIAEGRISAIGASNWSTERIAAANEYAHEKGLAPFVASQIQASLATPNWEPGPDPTVRYLTDEDAAWYAMAEMPVLAYSSTSGGYFAGRGHEEGLYANALNKARYRIAQQIADELNCTPLQVAMAYLLCQPLSILPIFSTTHADHLEEILKATKVVLTLEHLALLKEPPTS